MQSLTKSHVTGFLLSLILTLAAYFIVVKQMLSGTTILALIAALAIAQATIQLFYFLHIGQEKKPHWKLTLFFFMFIVVVVIVFGSLWIMYNLDYNVMPHNMESDAY